MCGARLTGSGRRVRSGSFRSRGRLRGCRKAHAERSKSCEKETAGHAQTSAAATLIWECSRINRVGTARRDLSLVCNNEVYVSGDTGIGDRAAARGVCFTANVWRCGKGIAILRKSFPEAVHFHAGRVPSPGRRFPKRRATAHLAARSCSLSLPRPGSSVVERGPEKAGVGGSIPSLATTLSNNLEEVRGAASPAFEIL